MTTYKDSKALANLSLGKETQYVSEYNPDLLQAVPRSLNRDDLSLDQANLPFVGEDIWYGYELSWLNAKGKPVVAVAEFSFPCTSINIVESKSFKLYLNSFNQTKFHDWQQVTNTLTQDLSKLTQSEVMVDLYKVNDCPRFNIGAVDANCIDDVDIEISDYQFSAQYLENAVSDITNNEIVTEHLVSHLLKSNCLITNQPDWATIYIQYKGCAIDHAQLLRYLISFRQHNEFHEQCVERIFCDIQKYCAPHELTVYARYTRRGGLDINPYRTTTSNKAQPARTFRQ